MEWISTAPSWGILPQADELYWARFDQQAENPWAYGQGAPAADPESPVSARRTVAGLSAVRMALRQTHFPFSRLAQIRTVLPQEATDSLLRSPDSPWFGLSCSPDESGCNVLYAAIEKQQVADALARLAGQGTEPAHLVVSELGTLPLLSARGLLSDQRTWVVVDTSMSPQAVYAVKGARILGLRLVSEAALAAGDEAVEQELSWLAEGMRAGQGEVGLMGLGNTREYWQQWESDSAWAQVSSPDLQDLLPGAPDWRWLRAAGLALAGPEEVARMLDLRWGEQAYKGPWAPWLKPWRGVLALLLLALTLKFGIAGWQIMELRERYRDLGDDIRQEFQRVMPNVPMVEPLSQLQQRLGQKAGDSEGSARELRAWFALIQTMVPKHTGVTWQQLHFEQGEVQLLGEVGSYEHLDQVKESLAKAVGDGTVELQDAQILSKSKLVSFKLRLR